MSGFIKGFFGKRPTTKGDVIVAVGAALLAALKAGDVYREYKAESATTESKENDK